MKWGRESDWDLYHVAKDPAETNNLAADHPDRVREMDQLFQQWQRETTSSTVD